MDAKKIYFIGFAHKLCTKQVLGNPCLHWLRK